MRNSFDKIDEILFILRRADGRFSAQSSPHENAWRFFQEFSEKLFSFDANLFRRFVGVSSQRLQFQVSHSKELFLNKKSFLRFHNKIRNRNNFKTQLLLLKKSFLRYSGRRLMGSRIIGSIG